MGMGEKGLLMLEGLYFFLLGMIWNGIGDVNDLCMINGDLVM